MDQNARLLDARQDTLCLVRTLWNLILAFPQILPSVDSNAVEILKRHDLVLPSQVKKDGTERIQNFNTTEDDIEGGVSPSGNTEPREMPKPSTNSTPRFDNVKLPVVSDGQGSSQTYRNQPAEEEIGNCPSIETESNTERSEISDTVSSASFPLGMDYTNSAHFLRNSRKRSAPTTRDLSNLKPVLPLVGLNCTVCGRRCSNRGGLASHMKSHLKATPVVSPFVCRSCGKVCGNPGGLAVHMKSHSLGAKCVICGFFCSTPSALKKHKLTHVSSQSCYCPVCRRRCGNKGGLSSHMKTHPNLPKVEVASERLGGLRGRTKRTPLPVLTSVQDLAPFDESEWTDALVEDAEDSSGASETNMPTLRMEVPEEN